MMKQLNRLLILVLLLLVVVTSGCSKDKVLSDFFEKLEIPNVISDDVILLNEYNFNGKTINVTWVSTNTDVISTTGKVTIKNVEVELSLIATANYGGKTMKKVYNVKTIKDDTEDILNAAKSSMIMPEYTEKSLSLPKTKVVAGKTIEITWQSSHVDIIDETGLVVLGKEETNVELTATLMLNGKQVQKSFLIKVPKGHQYTNGELFARASVYMGEIKGALYPDKQKEFAGAVYYKVQSSSDAWQGIETIVTLPEWIPDENRTGKNPYSPTDLRYLDNPSVYLGNHCIYESDVGLSWMVGSLDSVCSRVDYSKSVAFRPFWRFMENGKNTFVNAPWTKPEFYYYPGDKIRMSVYNASEGKMQLRIELLEETTIEKYAIKRASYMLGKNYEKVFTSPEFTSYGAGKTNASFKRVCALDQANNEGSPTQPTNAISKNIIWHEVYLYRYIDNEIRKVPMTSRYSSQIGAPSGTNALGDFTNAFKISYDGVDKTLGGQIVTISPNNGKTN